MQTISILPGLLIDGTGIVSWFPTLAPVKKRKDGAWRVLSDILPGSMKSLRLLRKLPAYVVPVDHLEEGLHVVGAPILILQVVGMFPHVHHQHRLVAQGERAVLVGSGFDGDGSVGQLDQPCPAAAEGG